MPTYEMSLILRSALSRPEVHTVLKRSCEAVMGRGGFVRKLENLGHKPLPYTMSSRGSRHSEGRYFLLTFDVPIKDVEEISQGYKIDKQIIKHDILRTEEPFLRPCLTSECEFGEITNPRFERVQFKKRVLKQITLSKKSKRN